MTADDRARLLDFIVSLKCEARSSAQSEGGEEGYGELSVES